MEPKGSLPHSQVLATSPYPEPDQFSPCLPNHFFMIHFNIILIYSRVFKVVSFPQVYSPYPCMYLSCPSSMSRPFHSSWSPQWYLKRKRDHKAPRQVVLSIPVTSLLLGPNNPLGLRPSLNGRDHVSLSLSLSLSLTHTHTQNNSSASPVFTFLDSTVEDKIFCTEC